MVDTLYHTAVLLVTACALVIAAGLIHVFDQMLNVIIGRDGTLCGKCAESYSATFGSLYSKCQTNCADQYKWELPLLSLLSAFVVVVAVLFNLNVASGVLRSFVFYFQMVGFTLNAVAPSGILSQKWVAYFAGIANLNFREDICMWKNMTPLHSTVLQ